MSFSLQHSSLMGSLTAPPAKSHAIRLLAGVAMAKGKSIIYNLGNSSDVRVAASIVNTHFADVVIDNNKVLVSSAEKKACNVIDCGESGLIARLFPVLKLLQACNFTVEGSGTLLHRPIALDLKQLNEFGVDIQTPNGNFLPVKFIGGQLKNGKYKIEGSRSSQFVSGLLMSLPLLDGDSELLVNDISSFPYIMLTVQTLKSFGINVFHQAPNRFIIPGNQHYCNGDYVVEGDWSSAAFLFAAGVLLGKVSISGLNPYSEQSDKNILEILQLANVDFAYENGIYSVQKSKILAFDYDFMHSPDLFPVALLLAVHANGVSRFTGISKLYLKESNRIDALCKEFSKSGVHIICLSEALIVTGNSNLRFAKYNSHNDHRVAMTLILHALACAEGGEIDSVDCIDKSYPHFLKDIVKIGGLVNE